MRIFRLLQYIFPIFIAVGLSAGTVRVESLMQNNNISRELDYYEDVGGALTIKDIQEAKDIKWVDNPNDYINFGYSSSAFWLKFELDNLSESSRRIYLELDFSSGDFVDLYIVKKDGTVEVRETGDQLPFHNRQIKDRNFVFVLDLDPAINTYYLRVKSTSSLRFHVLVISPDAFMERINRDVSIIWLYYGCMLLVMIHSFFNFIITKEKAYLYFACFCLIFFIEEMVFMGYAFQYLWPNSVWLANNAILYTLCITMILYNLFLLSYLDARNKYPRINRLALAIGIIPGLIYLPLTAFISFQTALSVILPNIIIVAVIQIMIIVYALIKGDRTAIYLVIGTCFTTIAVPISILTYANVFPLNPLTKWILQLAFTLQMLSSSLGLAAKINTMKNALKSSESKLAATNLELKTTNQKMILQNQELLSTHEALEHSEERFRTIIEQAPLSIEVFDLEGFLVQTNPARAKLWDGLLTNANGRFNILTDERVTEWAIKDSISRVFQGRNPIMEEWSYQPPGNHHERDTKYLRTSIYPVRSTKDNLTNIVVIHEDITEKKITEKMMIQTDKMINLGGLIAGIAHEINNPLAAVIQNIQVALNRITTNLPANEKVAARIGISLAAVKQYLEERNVPGILKKVASAGERAAQIIINMLSFSRKSDSKLALNSIVDLLETTITLSENDYDLRKKYDFKKIEIIRDYDPSLSGVMCQASMIQQVFLNILKNGAQAMAKAIQETGRSPRFRLTVKPEPSSVRIEIEDNGPGMDEETCSQIFNPFFTTKSAEEGTGIGLHVSRFIIVDAHKGTIDVNSTPGKGSTFIIRLPIVTISNDTPPTL
ncbi:PAS domain S-box protein [bacterium]|nr:PAS domain S-box protein [bacterium]